MEAAIKINYLTRPYEVLAVVGSTPCLGTWDTNYAVLAQESGPKSGNWVAEVELDSHHHEWKWVVLDRSSGSVVRWEEGQNRLLWSGNDGPLVVHTVWGYPSSPLSPPVSTQETQTSPPESSQEIQPIFNFWPCEHLPSLVLWWWTMGYFVFPFLDLVRYTWWFGAMMLEPWQLISVWDLAGLVYRCVRAPHSLKNLRGHMQTRPH